MTQKHYKWHKQYSRGSVCVSYQRQLGFGFVAVVSAQGTKEFPFPSEPEHIESWGIYIMIPGENSSPRLGKFKPNELSRAFRYADLKAIRTIDVTFTKLGDRAVNYSFKGRIPR